MKRLLSVDILLEEAFEQLAPLLSLLILDACFFDFARRGGSPHPEYASPAF
jgi:hypothetical protein